MGTIQLDFQLPRRFHCTYTDKDGSEKTPVVIHRVIYGSLERFIGILIEHTAGAFPVWIAPVQATIIPITDAQLDYARAVEVKLKAAGIRVEVDDSGKRMNAKIRARADAEDPLYADSRKTGGRNGLSLRALENRTRFRRSVGETSLYRMPWQRFAKQRLI